MTPRFGDDPVAYSGALVLGGFSLVSVSHSLSELTDSSSVDFSGLKLLQCGNC